MKVKDGNSAICSRLTTGRPNEIGFLDEALLYGKIPDHGLITMSGRDAGTQHMAKRTRMSAVGRNGRVTKFKILSTSGQFINEVAMYRRQRDHSKISNDNSGGRIFPMAYGVVIAPDGKKIDLKKIASDYKGTGIAIFAIHSEAYQEKNEERRNDTLIKEDDLCI